MAAPNFAQQAAQSYGYPTQTFGKREQQLFVSIKAYVDSLSPDTVITTQGDIIIGNASGDAARLAKGASGTVLVAGASTVSYAQILDANVGAAAAIAFSKLAALPDAQLLVGSAGNVATAVAVTGDIAISNAGVTSIAAGAIVDADVSGSAAIAYSKLALTDSIVDADIDSAAAIAYSKLASLPSAQILVGSAGGVATAVALSGDATISDAGALSLAAGSVALAELATAIAPSHVVKFASSFTTVGGAAAEAINIPGALSTDLPFIQLIDDGTANVSVLSAAVTADTLTVTFSANPGNDAIISYQLLRATA